METEILRGHLLKELSESKLRNPSYSLRSFALKLGMNPGALSQMLSGKRKISKKTAYQLKNQLNITPGQWKKIVGGDQYEGAEIELLDKHYYLLSNWYNFSILTLSECHNKKPTIDYISSELGISSTQVKKSVEVLVDLGLLEFVEGKTFRCTTKKFKTSDDVASSALQVAHRNNLDLAQKALSSQSVEVRDFTSSTLAIDIKKLPKAKELIREFHQKMEKLLVLGNQEKVYKLNIQLFDVNINNKELK